MSMTPAAALFNWTENWRLGESTDNDAPAAEDAWLQDIMIAVTGAELVGDTKLDRTCTMMP